MRHDRHRNGSDKWAGPAGVFFGVAFVGAGLLGAVQPATGIPDEVVQLTQFGPALGVLAVALVWPSRTRTLLVPRQATLLPGGARRVGRDVSPWPLLATAVVIILLATGMYALLSGDAHLTDPRTLAHPFVLIAAAQLVGACGEEIGWRCLLQPLLRTRFRPLAASVVVGVVWGLWHVQVFGRAPAYAAGFLLATTAMSVVLGLGLERVRANRLLLAGGFHTLVNLGMLLCMDEESGRVLPMVLFGLAALVAAVPWAVHSAGVARREANACRGTRIPGEER
ncbi:CPBP family intramembrane glutamic endopeptidase [Streptomyces sp. NPDC001020]